MRSENGKKKWTRSTVWLLSYLILGPYIMVNNYYYRNLLFFSLMSSVLQKCFMKLSLSIRSVMQLGNSLALVF